MTNAAVTFLWSSKNYALTSWIKAFENFNQDSERSSTAVYTKNLSSEGIMKPIKSQIKNRPEKYDGLKRKIKTITKIF